MGVIYSKMSIDEGVLRLKVKMNIVLVNKLTLSFAYLRPNNSSGVFQVVCSRLSWKKDYSLRTNVK